MIEIDHEESRRAVITTMVDHITFGKSDNDLSHSMHTTDKRIASWSERANVYKEYMARSRHEAPQKNTSRRSRGSIEGRLEAPMKGLTQHTNTAINTQSKHWHRSMNRLKIPPNPSTPDLRVGAMWVFEHAPCPLPSMEPMHSICPSTPFFHPHQNTLNTISPLLAA